jgi:hypothetical protein
MGVRVRGKATARPEKAEDPAFNEERGTRCRGPESLDMNSECRWRAKLPGEPNANGQAGLLALGLAFTNGFLSVFF